MSFGISPAPEEFQRRLDNALQGLADVMPIFDDILIFGAGNTKAEAMADHDAKLRALMQRCREKGIKLKKEKLKLRCKEVPFMGHVISVIMSSRHPTMIQGIQEMLTPSSKQDVKRLLGMANYLQRFAPNLSEDTAPLRDLLKEDNQFLWDAAKERSFQELKKTISKAPVLKFFDPKDNFEIQYDASDRGLGCCIMQNGQPCVYASPSMTETEAHYAQIEKEMLSIVFAVERLEQCVYGRPVKVQTDHKPLESIFKKSLISAPKRLQRMLLRLQKFDLEVTCKKDTEIVLADTLSRAYKVPQQGESAAEATRDETEKDVTQYIPMSEETQTRMQRATEEDKALRDLKTVIRHGWPLLKEDVPIKVRDYFPSRDELTMQNGLVFKGEILVIPTSLRDEMREKLQSSHIGIQGYLRRAREALHWPGMNEKVEDYIAKCSTCNSYQSEQAKEPMIERHM